MAFIIIMFLSALSIAGVAAYFSITGLVALFSASAISIIIMGSVLEAGKLVAVSYLYRYWPLINYVSKFMLSLFIILLMAITSIGIFGFLSKAHIEKVGPQEQYVLQIEQLDEKIANQRIRLERNQKILNNLDEAFDKYVELGYISRGLKKREEQEEERTAINENIREIENRISELNAQKLEYKEKIQDIELEVGPIKYVAEIVYGDSENAIEKAVKILIIMLVCTFDPLAITLLIGANHAFLHRNDKRVRSEFSILDSEGKEHHYIYEESDIHNQNEDIHEEKYESDDLNEKETPVQTEKLYYDELSEDEKEDKFQEVKEFLKEHGVDEDEDEDEIVNDEYQAIMSKDNRDNTSSKYSIVPLDNKDNQTNDEQEKPKKKKFFRSSWLPRNSKE